MVTQIINEKRNGYFNSVTIWCEHFYPLLYLSGFFSEKDSNLKIIFSHHDFLFKLLLKRATKIKQVIRALFLRNIEKQVLKMNLTVCSGSVKELGEIGKISSRTDNLIFLPAIYPPLEKFRKVNSQRIVRIYHLGTSKATANRIGLIFFFKEVFPQIAPLDFQLEFFGDVQDFVLSRFPELKNHPKIIFHGFVQNLEESMEEGMIHIIPYAGFTGTRTRISNLIRFKPCLLGFPNMQDSYPFLENGKNALIAEGNREFISLLKKLITDEDLRNKISSGVERDLVVFSEGLTKGFQI
jgi:hypothetical protein